jgi:hypothetical protein
MAKYMECGVPHTREKRDAALESVRGTEPTKAPSPLRSAAALQMVALARTPDRCGRIPRVDSFDPFGTFAACQKCR